MPAFFIAIRNTVTDPAEIATYREMGAAASVGHEMKRMVGYGKIRSLVGFAPEGVAMLEFPTFEAAEKWFESPDYQAALKHLFKGADYQMFIVEGKTPEP